MSGLTAYTGIVCMRRSLTDESVHHSHYYSEYQGKLT